MACPDRGVADEVLAGCRAGEAQCAFTVIDPELPRTEVAWAPSWPPVRWVWVSENNDLRLHEVTGEPEEILALAFQASGAVSIPFDCTEVRGSWTLEPHAAIDVRAKARLWGAALMVGIAQAAIDETIEYTTDRVVFGKPVAHHQANAFDLAAAAAGVHAARLVVRLAAASYDRGEPHTGFWATQAWLEAV
ncbi:MAG: acyl-CoA dehydrogenase family protein, partial [Actinomycetota bacterium]|nr:acyl-CoA dehydrogenase family protein [Actinomycetota bacterium]